MGTRQKWFGMTNFIQYGDREGSIYRAGFCRSPPPKEDSSLHSGLVLLKIVENKNHVEKEEEMIKKLRFPILAIFFSLGLIFTHPGSSMGVDDVKVGVVLPMTGGLAHSGAQLKTGAELAVEDINAAGGIKSMGGAKIKLIVGDSKSSADGGAAETERLITLEKVSALLGSMQSSVVFVGTQIGEKYKVPWLVVASVKDEITERGFKYTFRDRNKTFNDVEEILKAVELFSKKTGKKPTNYGMLYEGGDWGRSNTKDMKIIFGKAGYKLVVEDFFPLGTVDFSSQLLKIKAAKPDMLFLCAFTPEHIIFQKQQMQQKLHCPFGLWTLGSGGEDPVLYKSVPKESLEYMFVQEDWDIHAVKKFWFPSLDKRARAKNIEGGFMVYVAEMYGHMNLLYDALERAASGDGVKLQAALKATDISTEKCGPSERKIDGKPYCASLVRGHSKIKFDEKNENPFAHGFISQVQKDGERIYFWPGENQPAGAQLAWPIPPWGKR